MLLAIHVGLAFLSFGYAAYSAWSPSVYALRTVSALAFGTFLSGIGLLILHPSALPQLCTSGLVYIALILGASALISVRTKHMFSQGQSQQ